MDNGCTLAFDAQPVEPPIANSRTSQDIRFMMSARRKNGERHGTVSRISEATPDGFIVDPAQSFPAQASPAARYSRRPAQTVTRYGNHPSPHPDRQNRNASPVHPALQKRPTLSGGAEARGWHPAAHRG